MLAREQEINIVLPFSREDYIEQSVSRVGGNWLQRFDRVMAAATSVTYATSERYLGDDTLFEHATCCGSGHDLPLRENMTILLLILLRIGIRVKFPAARGVMQIENLRV